MVLCWLSVDPLADFNPLNNDEHYIDGEHNDGIYNSFNNSSYSYCYQNPVRYVDPNGKQVDIIDFIPIIGSSRDIYRGVRDGDWVTLGIGIAGLALDVGTLGSGTVAKGISKAAIKQSIKVIAELSAKQMVKVGAEAFTKGFIKLTEETAYKDLIKGFHKHHLIPKAVYKLFEKDFLGIMGRDVAKNLKKLPSKFHGSHYWYNQYIKKELTKLAETGINKESVDGLLKKASSEINKAYENFMKSGGAENMNDYFRKIMDPTNPKNFKKVP
jgi:hypothetical protein